MDIFALIVLGIIAIVVLTLWYSAEKRADIYEQMAADEIEYRREISAQRNWK